MLASTVFKRYFTLFFNIPGIIKMLLISFNHFVNQICSLKEWGEGCSKKSIMLKYEKIKNQNLNAKVVLTLIADN